MKLREWMSANDHDDATFAAAVAARLPQGETCSKKTVEKWRYGTRTPRRKALSIISHITAGSVTPNDFADLPIVSMQRSSEERAKSDPATPGSLKAL